MDEHRLKKVLSGSKPNQLVQYWSSFDDHIEKLKKEIKAEKNEIAECQETIKGLEAELKKVELEKESFTLDDYKPTNPFTEDFQKKNSEFCEKVLKHIKAHEVQYHTGLIGNFMYEEDGFRFVHQVHCPHYHFEASDTNPLKIKYVVCDDCLNRSARERFSSINAYMTIDEEANGHT